MDNILVYTCLQNDLVAGISVAALVIPQGMSYAKLAGLPNQYGLYGAFVPVIIYATLGSSRHLVSGHPLPCPMCCGNSIVVTPCHALCCCKFLLAGMPLSLVDQLPWPAAIACQLEHAFCSALPLVVPGDQLCSSPAHRQVKQASQEAPPPFAGCRASCCNVPAAGDWAEKRGGQGGGHSGGPQYPNQPC